MKVAADQLLLVIGIVLAIVSLLVILAALQGDASVTNNKIFDIFGNLIKIITGKSG